MGSFIRQSWPVPGGEVELRVVLRNPVPAGAFDALPAAADACHAIAVAIAAALDREDDDRP